jgi:DNA invertase Pin-like site-specific DNA recombinase
VLLLRREQPRREPGRMEEPPEVVPRIGEMGARGGGDTAWIDPAEDDYFTFPRQQGIIRTTQHEEKREMKPLDVYVRVSRVGDRNGDSFISPQLQEERCRALARARGYEVGEVVTDLDRSGGTMDRPGLNRALERIRGGASGGIIVARIDRFARTLPGALSTIEEINSAGGVLIECDGNWDTSTPMGRFGRDLVLRIGQLYREQVAEAWDDAKRSAVERGVHPTAWIPFGYRRERGRGLEPDPQLVEHVRQLFKLRSRGASWNELCEYLEGQRVRPMRARRWTIMSVKQIVANPVYLGEARMGGHVNPRAHEPLVTRSQWNAAQIHHPGRTKRGTDGARLAGLVFCASCGGRMTPELPGRDPDKGPGRYKCRPRNASANTDCPAPASARMDDLDALVVERFLDRYREPVGQIDDEPPAPETAELARALEAAESVRNALIEDVASLAALPSEKRAEVLANAQAAVDDARRALDEVEVAHETSVLNVWDLGDLFEPDGFMEAPVPEQRRLLSLGIEAVRVGKPSRKRKDRAVRMRELQDRVEIAWHE